MRSFRRWWVPAALALICAGSWALAETLFVQSDATPVRTAADPASETLAELTKGTQVEVVAREGYWVKVKAGDREGYVYGESLGAAAPPAAGAALGGLGSVLKGSEPSDLSASAAASGLQADTEKVASAKKMDTSAVRWMERNRAAIRSEEIAAFAAAGQVGPHRVNAPTKTKPAPKAKPVDGTKGGAR
jgi:hypothetical protein